MALEREESAGEFGYYGSPALEGDVLPEEAQEVLAGQYRGETYYAIPPIKHSHYKWRTSAAFLCNSVGGGSQLLALISDLLGDRGDRSLVRSGRYAALAGGALSAGLLISELHTRSRWYNMLRMFKRTSPMSIGIWSIMPFALLSGLTAGSQLLEDRGYRKTGRWMGRIFGIPAGLVGAVVMTYMGTELEETNMPVWASAYPFMAPMYAATGLSNAASALLIASERQGGADGRDSLRRVALISGAAEMVLGAAIQKRWSSLPEVASFEKSAFAPLFHGGFLGAGVIAPLFLHALEAFGRKRFSGLSLPASIAKLAGGLLTQIVMIYAGRESGMHARDYFEYTEPESARTMAPEKPRGATHVRSISAVLGLGALAVSAGFLFGKRRKR